MGVRQLGGSIGQIDPTVVNRRLLRWMALPFGIYLALAPTVYPWYLTLVLVMLPFLWTGDGEEARHARRWIWPWIYFMFLEAFTYLAYSGVSAPRGLELIRTLGYIPFWLLLVWAGLPEVKILLDLSRI
jgi:hypothetical protein